MTMHLAIQEGTTDVIVYPKWLNKSDGTAATTVDFNSAGISVNYIRRGFDAVAITLADGTDPAVASDAHSDGQMIHVYNGVCRLDLPDNVCASGLPAGQAWARLSGESDDFEMEDIVIQLTEYQPGTDLIGTPAGASVSADIAAVKTVVDAVLVDTGTTLQGELDGIQADTEDIQSKIGSPAGASVSADIAAVKAQTAAIETDTQDIQTKIGSPAGASVSADVAAVKVDTAAILVDTGTSGVVVDDSTPIEANVKAINDVALTGDGTSGTPWGPA